MNEKCLPLAMLESFPAYDREKLSHMLREELASLKRKIVVLDDDPTGVQTVHDVYVYTDWKPDTLLAAFQAPEPMFFILTNSRGFSYEATVKSHTEMACNIAEASRLTGKDFIVISRSDSTLRGHYPTEPQVLRAELERQTGVRYDGEIMLPFFREGGRYTLGDVHYVAMGHELVPAADTEFAKDSTFGYHSSNLKEYVAEKHGGKVKPEDVLSISLESLRAMDVDGIVQQLMQVNDFGKVIVNAIDYTDVEMFILAFAKAVKKGKRFLFRSAAAVTKVLGGVSDKPLLTSEELADHTNPNGGLIVVGSHVTKTTLQLNQLKKADFIRFVEFDVTTVANESAFTAEQERVQNEIEGCIRRGQTIAVYTSRKRLEANTGNDEDNLRLSLRISQAVTGFVKNLTLRPNFIIAKGGITSSEVGTVGLSVVKARVMGQILPGIPVWQTGPESKFPGLPYVIFPGNVGDENALYNAVLTLKG